MKITKFILPIAVMLAVFSSCTVRQVQYDKRTVTVNGTGSVEVEADTATLILSVVTTAREATTAATSNATRMEAVTKAILDLGVPENSISTQNYSIRQETQQTAQRIIYGDYKVSNEIKVFLKDKSMASSVIDASIRAGANRLSSLTFGILDSQLVVKQARTLAVQQAQEAAALIAGTSGAELGKILTITEYTNGGIFAARNFASAKAEASLDSAAEMVSTPISSGRSTVTVTVNATYELK